MNDDNLKLLKDLIGDTYINVATQSRTTFTKRVNLLLKQKKIPKLSFNDGEIEILLKEFANMDANNFHSFCGVGEREGRIYSNLVRNRHFGLSHGVGRSGDVGSLQPKAVGSSAINALANHLVLHLFHMMGMTSAKSALIMPIATGMTLSLSMSSLREDRPAAKYVVWARIDQRSCFKSIITAGYIPLIIEPILVGEELQTNLAGIQSSIEQYGAEQILCVLTTTSCFAPRVPDDVIKVAKLCHDTSVPQIINNAYGVTLRRCMNIIEEASRRYGRAGVYLVVQSTDKNLMVPVGGALVVSCDPAVITKLAKTYPGRASATPSIDVLITLLSMGVDGFKKLVSERERNFSYLKEKLSTVAGAFGLRVMDTAHNPVSLALTLVDTGQARSKTAIGSHLFHRSVSGSRVVESAQSNPKETMVEGFSFLGFGSHSSTSRVDYLNVAAAIGQTVEEVDNFVVRLTAVLGQFYGDGDGETTPL